MINTTNNTIMRKGTPSPAQAALGGRDSVGRARRGFIFSIDAMFATVVLITLLSAIYLFSAQQRSSGAPLTSLDRKAADILLLLDRGGQLQSMDGGTITNSINDMVAPAVVNQTSIGIGETLSYQAGATDPLPVTYGINDTSRFSIDPNTGLLANITELGAGAHTVRLTASDTAGNSAVFDLTVVVRP